MNDFMIWKAGWGILDPLRIIDIKPAALLCIGIIQRRIHDALRYGITLLCHRRDAQQGQADCQNQSSEHISFCFWLKQVEAHCQTGHHDAHHAHELDEDIEGRA